jgi:fatty acid desaturase
MIVTTHSIFFRRWAIGKQTLRYRYLSCKKHPTIRYATLIIVLHLIFHFVLGILFGSICFYIVCRAPSLTYGIFLGINILLFFIDIKFSLPCNFLVTYYIISFFVKKKKKNFIK